MSLNIYNMAPNNMKEITEYDNVHELFRYCLEEEESRSPYYDENNIYAGLYSLKVFWIKGQSNQIGFAIMDDWKSKKIRWFKIGSDKRWSEFKNILIALNSHDNS